MISFELILICILEQLVSSLMKQSIMYCGQYIMAYNPHSNHLATGSKRILYSLEPGSPVAARARLRVQGGDEASFVPRPRPHKEGKGYYCGCAESAIS